MVSSTHGVMPLTAVLYSCVCEVGRLRWIVAHINSPRSTAVAVADGDMKKLLMEARFDQVQQSNCLA